MISDTTTAALEHALKAVALRQRTAAHNIANAATPGFRSQRVDFEQQLSSALDRGGPLEAAILTRPAATPISINGNDVLLEEESTILLESEIRYEALIAGLNHKLGLIRSAIGS
ncbi:MAG: flagellar basal body protein [Acidimicrobiales bacterium]